MQLRRQPCHDPRSPTQRVTRSSPSTLGAFGRGLERKTSARPRDRERARPATEQALIVNLASVFQAGRGRFLYLADAVLPAMLLVCFQLPRIRGYFASRRSVGPPEQPAPAETAGGSGDGIPPGPAIG